MGLGSLAGSGAGGLEELVRECERLMRELSELEMKLLELKHPHSEEMVSRCIRAVTLGFFALQWLKHTLTEMQVRGGSIQSSPAAYIKEVPGAERVC